MKARAVFCDCGAQWFGKYAGSEVIQSHIDRAANNRSGGCWMLTHEQFKVRHRCKCEECRIGRKGQRGRRRTSTSG